jgi:hypothetical protein
VELEQELEPEFEPHHFAGVRTQPTDSSEGFQKASQTGTFGTDRKMPFLSKFRTDNLISKLLCCICHLSKAENNKEMKNKFYY